MPARIARANLQVGPSKTHSRNKTRKRTLDAFSIASHSIKENKHGRSHRLGEVIDDVPTVKRRRVGGAAGSDDDEDADLQGDSGEDRPRRPKSKKRDLGDDDGVDEGSDSEGNHWTLGDMAEDDDDSDIDSDEAFGESDEEKFEGFTFKGSSSSHTAKRKKTKARSSLDTNRPDLDLSEEDAGEDSDDSLGDEAVDLATMLDNYSEDEEHASFKKLEGSDEDKGFAEDDDDSIDDDEDEFDAGDEERVARNRDNIEAMDRPMTSDDAPEVEDVLSMEDLLGDEDAPATAASKIAKKRSKKKAAISSTQLAPLPKRQQDRIERELASSKAKEQLDKWQDTVIQNRRAEHIQFPLKDPNAQGLQGKTKFIRNAPRTDLEKNIQRILEESGLTSEAGAPVDDDDDLILKSEGLNTKDVPVEEIVRRRAELRRARELLFREEIKAKRIAKIKSKSYRRVHRREKERLAEKEREFLDPEGRGLPLDENEREYLDRKRAEERMSTKHRDSKWAKSLKATNRAAWDEDARSGAHEQARRIEDLKRRIEGKDVAASSESDFSAEDSDAEEMGDGEAEGDRTLRQLNRLRNLDDEVNHSRIGSMKFMQAADARRRAQNNEIIEDMRKSLVAEDDEDGASDDEEREQGIGRAVFGPQSQETTRGLLVKRPVLEEGEPSGDEQYEGDLSGQGMHRGSSNNALAAQGAIQPSAGSAKRKNDVHTRPLTQIGAIRDAKEQSLNSSWLTDTNAKIPKQERARHRASDRDVLAVSQIAVENPAKKAVTKPNDNLEHKKVDNVGATTGWTNVKLSSFGHGDSDNDDEGEEDRHTEPLIMSKPPPATYHSRAFAGDDVEQAFAAEKDAAIASEDEKEVSTHLPGWGSWTGDGLSKAIRKSNARQKHNPLYKTKLPGGVSADKRKDRKLDNVIISEKQNRKGKKYLAPMLPHEFERKDQYERSLRIPIGPEWTTKETFQRSTKPRVVVKQGIVAPMERPFV